MQSLVKLLKILNDIVRVILVSGIRSGSVNLYSSINGFQRVFEYEKLILIFLKMRLDCYMDWIGLSLFVQVEQNIPYIFVRYSQLKSVQSVSVDSIEKYKWQKNALGKYKLSFT